MSNFIYDDCGCSSNNQKAGVRPPNLKCPPDLSTMLFRFVDRKSLGIVKGNTELFKIDMSSFFLQLENYSVFTLVLCPGETKQINVSNIANTGKRKQITEFSIEDLQNLTLDINTTAELEIVEDGNTLATITNIDANSFTNFVDDLNFKVLSDTTAGNLITISSIDPVLKITTKDKGRYLEYILTFTNSQTFVSEELEGVITQTAERYPNLDHVKLLFAAVEYCSDCKTNTQFIEYAYTNDYLENGNNANWRKTSKLLMQMGADDIVDDDMNWIETLWLKNTIDCKVNIHIIIGI
jgi:hypothetical protein